MYDHLSRIVSRLLETQPPDAVDIVEDLSRQLKYERFCDYMSDPVCPTVRPNAFIVRMHISLSSVLR